MKKKIATALLFILLQNISAHSALEMREPGKISEFNDPQSPGNIAVQRDISFAREESLRSAVQELAQTATLGESSFSGILSSPRFQLDAIGWVRWFDILSAIVDNNSTLDANLSDEQLKDSIKISNRVYAGCLPIVAKMIDSESSDAAIAVKKTIVAGAGECKTKQANRRSHP